LSISTIPCVNFKFVGVSLIKLVVLILGVNTLLPLLISYILKSFSDVIPYISNTLGQFSKFETMLVILSYSNLKAK
jgi:hypothetical protein